ncbi:MAG: DNA methyltransferase, partial [Armatimonadota bacterium]|nr:DNA methyltransferase [Armatimonadota bacterium]
MSEQEPEAREPKSARTRANGLDGSAWTRNSISVWSDLRKGPGEAALRHPAMFPLALPVRLIECFTPPGPGLVLDPFAGSGSTPLAAWMAGKEGLGIELSPDFVALAEARCQKAKTEEEGDRGTFRMITGQAQTLDRYVTPHSVQLCITSPPYWNILEQKRSADGKELRDYGDASDDLGKVAAYET